MNCLRLSLPELVCIGYAMEAETLEQGYLDALDEAPADIIERVDELNQALESRGIIRRFMSGRVTVKTEYEELLRPIFFGERVTALDVGVLTPGAQSAEFIRVHYMGEECVRTVMEGDMLTVCEAQPEEVRRMVTNRLPEKLEPGTGEPTEDKLDVLIAAKDLRISGESTQEHFAISGTELYKIEVNGFEGIDRTAAMQKLIETIC